MSDKIKLLPCPFCGGENVFRAAGGLGGYHIFCDDCFAESGTGETEEEAAEIWNHRVAAPAAPVAQEPVAYLTTDGERVITAKTYNDAKRDGGAMWSSIRSFTVAAYSPTPAAEQPDTVAVPRELLEALEMVMRRGRIDDSEEAMNQVAAAITKDKEAEK